MHLSHAQIPVGHPAMPVDLVARPAPPRWDAALRGLRTSLSPSVLLRTVCMAVAAELSLSTVAVLQRTPAGGLRCLARSSRSESGRLGFPGPWSPPLFEDAAYAFHRQGGPSGVVLFSGTAASAPRNTWAPWAQRLIELLLTTIETDAAIPSVQAGARFSALRQGLVDHHAASRELVVRVTLQGLHALEPLDAHGWERLLGVSAARVIAIAGAERVEELGDGEFLVCLPRHPQQALQLLEAVRHALLVPIAGVGVLPSLGVRIQSP